MPDALTESFCERCGTRYEFAAPEPLTPMRKTRGLISGLKNYILSEDSLSDAVGDAMRSQEELLSAKQLDAFHSTFNFCIDCRQYTCTNCWNDGAGRCQSCQPLPQVEGLARRFETTMGEVQPDYGMAMSWPTSDVKEPLPASVLELPELAPLVAEPEPMVAEPEPMVAEPEPVVEPMPALAEAEPELVAAAEEEAEPEPIPAERWADLVPTLAEVDPIPAEPMVAAEPEAEPVAAEAEPEPEPEPVAPEPVAPEPIPLRPLRPISDTFLHYPRAVPSAAQAAEDEDALAARAAQLDMLGLGDPGQGPVAPSRPVLLPYRSSGAAAPGSDRLAAASAPGAIGFWDASAREVADAISQIGVRSCAQCELSLSATARFCRRCGTPQAQSA